MSRHRDIRNMDYEDALDDDALSDGGEEDMTAEQTNQMNRGLEEVYRVLGGEAVSGISDKDLRKHLWDNWFDPAPVIQWALEEQVRRERRAAKEKEKAQRKLAQQKIGGSSSATSANSSRAASRAVSPTPSAPSSPIKMVGGGKKSGVSTPARSGSGDPRMLDLAAMNLTSLDDPAVPDEPLPKITIAREKVLEEAKMSIQAEESGFKPLNLVVIGHVDAGKSTLMGRLLYDLGGLDEKTKIANERGSSKIGKSSFSWAWGFDGTAEERERGITMDIAQRSLKTPHRQITILDAPGHKEFVPNMISGASQADCALLVVDAGTGEFEAGFDRGGQTREHLILVRSLGVAQVVVSVNKLDQVNWSQDRYKEILDYLKPFLLQTGFQPSKTKFVPVGAMDGVNLIGTEGEVASSLREWYTGPTLVDLLDTLEPPARNILAPTRIPVSNVYRTQVSGRLTSGVIQVGEKLRVLPGDETAIVKTIELEDESVPWAMAGASVVISLTAIDSVQLNIGSVLCPPSDPIPLATVFTARIIVFDVDIPITTGASVELFHHSRDVSATISRMLLTLDRATGRTIKSNPRFITKNTSAEIQITLRSNSPGLAPPRPIPLEPFAVNKDMGRILIRRGGETIGAGIVLEIIT